MRSRKEKRRVKRKEREERTFQQEVAFSARLARSAIRYKCFYTYMLLIINYKLISVLF